MRERFHRSLLKAISYRVTGTVGTMIVSFVVTGQAKLAVSIGVVEFFTKIGIYYLHERVWDRIGVGRVPPNEDYQI